MQQFIQRILRALAVGYIVRGIRRLISGGGKKNDKNDNNDKS